MSDPIVHQRQRAHAQLEAAIESLRRTQNIIDNSTSFRREEYPMPSWQRAVEDAWQAAVRAQQALSTVAVR